jgi:hypothetical protein
MKHCPETPQHNDTAFPSEIERDCLLESHKFGVGG